MQRSEKRFLTTHVGSLPNIIPLREIDADYETKLSGAVEQVVAKQRAIGLDIINEGEYTKGGDWLSFIESRFGGFEQCAPPATDKPFQLSGKDREDFAVYYKYATEKGVLFFSDGEQIEHAGRKFWSCTAPITYTGGDELAREIDLTKRAAGSDNVFLTSTAPASIEPYRQNDFYKSEEDFLFALAEALAVEYKTIIDAGLILQIDDAWLPALWDRIGIQMGLEKFLKYSELRIDALNHALKDVPEDRVRYHLCWGSWHGPHAYDLELKHLVDLLLKVRAQGYLIEGGNARHEHEWQVWENVKLPDGKILIPGVVSHATVTIEHSELVAQRIARYASVVGKENVIPGADCGFGGRAHPQISWAKLQALTDGARLASKKLF